MYYISNITLPTKAHEYMMKLATNLEIKMESLLRFK